MPTGSLGNQFRIGTEGPWPLEIEIASSTREVFNRYTFGFQILRASYRFAVSDQILDLIAFDI